MTEGESDPTWTYLPDGPMDLAATFGPMSAMHATMDKLGVGMQCGLIARFQGKTASEVEDAIAVARRQFPVLLRRVTWIGHRPVLAMANPTCRNRVCASSGSLLVKPNPDGLLWRYMVVQDDGDTWLSAIWAHAAADGPSMLRFLETIVAETTKHPVQRIQMPPPRAGRQYPIGRWLMRFLFEQSRRYVGITEGGVHPPGVAWLNVPAERTAAMLKSAQAGCGSFAAWLAGAACLAFCEQQNSGSAGRVLLNVLSRRDGLEWIGGFGFGAGSLLMSIKLTVSSPLPGVARRISARLKKMIDERWDDNFERFLGSAPKRHLRFASLYARGLSPPVLSVSWKGSRWQVGGIDGVRDIACFAASPVAHISGHVDRNGLSLSVASCQSAASREDLLRRVASRLGEEQVDRVLTFDDAHAFEMVGIMPHAKAAARP